MIDKVMKERISKLIEVACYKRRQIFPRSVGQFKATTIPNNSFMTSTTMKEIKQMCANELELRAAIIWKSIVRVCRDLPGTASDLLGSDLKQEFSKYLNSTADELTSYLSQQLNVFSKFPGKNEWASLNETYNYLIQKHEVEIDLYIEYVTTQKEEIAVPPRYNFYGNVGAVQTGANALANVVQNLSEGDKTALMPMGILLPWIIDGSTFEYLLFIL
jgi:hypothetical protein